MQRRAQCLPRPRRAASAHARRTLSVALGRPAHTRFHPVLHEPPWYESGSPPRLSTEAYLAAARTLDLVLSLMALPFLLPILMLCALAVRLETPGAPFFQQQRTGRHGRRFAMYKLRTMVKNAGELKAQLAHLNELSWPDFKIKNDSPGATAGALRSPIPPNPGTPS